jgi:hypothetical protein
MHVGKREPVGGGRKNGMRKLLNLEHGTLNKHIGPSRCCRADAHLAQGSPLKAISAIANGLRHPMLDKPPADVLQDLRLHDRKNFLSTIFSHEDLL